MTVPKSFALRFIAGRYKGGEFPLRPNREIIIGRGSEFDMVLDEDMVSRRHAKISTFHGRLILEDLGSTNGSFVNGQRLSGSTSLNVGDKVLIGTSIMELLQGGRTSTTPRASGQPVQLQVPQPNQSTVDAAPAQAIAAMHASNRATGEHRSTRMAPAVTIDRAQGMSGRFPDDGVGVPDLVELFVNGGRSGVMVLTDDRGREGRIFFREGAIYFASYAGPARQADVEPLKAFNRLITWANGNFRFENISPPPSFEIELTEDPRGMLVEAVRQWDELKRYDEHLLPDEARLSLNIPLESRLSALSAEALDTLQVAINCVEIGVILDFSEATDLETWQDLLYLLQNGYLVEV